MEAASADVADVQRALRSRVWGKRAASTPTERKTKLAVGETVEVGALGIKGSVLTEPDNSGRVEVLVGSARLQMDVSRLRRTGEPVEEERPVRSAVSIPLSTPAPGIELDVRGERANEAVERLDAYIDSAIAYGLTHVRIVHGKGTGAPTECRLAAARGQQRGGVVRIRAARTGRGRRDRGGAALGLL